MPVFRHIGILVWKNLIVLKRSKKWLFFELALGLLFIPYLFIILKVERNTKTNIMIYEPVNVTGDYKDIDRDIPYISPIYSRVCSNETTINIGFAYPNTINDTVMHLFEKRYANKDSLYKVVPHKFNSLKDMRRVLHNVSTLMCGTYIGGIYISKLNISARQFSYRIFVPDKGSDWHTNKFWPDGGPYGDSAAKLATFTGIIPQSPPYWTSGYLSFQRALDAIFLEMVGKPTDTPIQLNRFPTPSFQKNGALVLIGSFRFYSMSFLFVYRVVGVLLHTTKEIVSEKESGIRTHLLVMGLDSLAFYGSHFVIALIKITIVMGSSSIILAINFENISPFLIVPFCMVFGVTVVLICIFVSVCCRRSSVAVMAIWLIWFGMYKFDDYLNLTRTRIKNCFFGSLNVYTAFKLGIQAMGSFESRMIHLNWLNMFSESTVSFSIGCAFLMLIVDIIILSILIYYFDNVWPTDDSPRKHPLFFLPCIGKPDLAVEFDYIPTLDDDTDSAPYLSMYDEADISVRNMTKIYETGQVAVDGLSFEAYRGQLTVLLGHNGAGKSTTFSVISGISASTRGEVYICRRNIEYELSECQKEIGYCPQYNPLFKKLTVEEHLRLYGKLKSNIWDTVGEEKITRLLNEINLMEKRNDLAKNLSGGMKRKLCVAMALVGNSRVVLLDEPTAGMDPEARHEVAQMLVAEKKHRTILMTTHNMDEADLLGDQIAIMCKGRLVCKGSSEHLKKRFGTGYILTLVINSDAAVHEDSIQLAIDATMDVIKNCVPNAKLESTCGMQFSVSLPSEDTNLFVHLFEELEFRKGELGLLTFGLSLSTLEQVFLRVGEMADPTGDQEDCEVVSARASALFGHCGYRAKPWTVFLTQIFAILCRYFLNAWRHKQRTLFPFILLALTPIMGHSAFNPVIKQTRSFNLLKQEAFTIPMQVSPNETIANFSYFASKIPHSTHVNLAQNVNFSKKVLDHGYDYPPLGIGVQVVNKTYRMFFNGAAYHGPPLALNFLSNTILNESVNSINAEIKVYSPVDKESKQGHSTGDTYNTPYILTMVCFSFLTSLYVMPLVDDRVSCFKHQLLLTKLKKVTYWFAVTLFYLIFYMLFCLMFSTMLVFFKVIPSSLFFAIVLLCALYFIAATPMSYVASFAFTSPIHATTAMLSVNFIAGPILVVTFKLILSFLNFVRVINVIYSLLYIALPAFPFVGSVSDIYRQCGQNGNVEDWDDIVAYGICIILSGCFWWLLLFLLEHSFEQQSFRGNYQNLSDSPLDSDTEELLDEDVRDEMIRVHETPYHRLALSVRDISKSFGNFRALRDVTFGVNPNDCFGLLGVNGAGKTTTFDIITGRTLATSGNAHVSGIDIRQMPVIGYCPQFDALPMDLTGRQVLTILGRLNAFYNVEKRVNIVLEGIQMTAQADKLVYHYSGGQKRRISIGVTLMSRASLIMLDEPTAGIDPKTRRHIWNLLCAIRDQRVAILLTSHSMDECEVLCSRIGFLNNGSLISIGSSQHLKSRFGNSFLLTLTVSNPSVNNLKYLNIIVMKKFGAKPTTDLYYMNILHWEIPRRAEDTWSDLYRRAQEIANCHHPTYASDTPTITDFSVTQNSLEHVFLRLSKLGALHQNNTHV